ncbi:MAG: alpha/beta fold hydrolase [Candidatus Thorarchaeota archaeon]
MGLTVPVVADSEKKLPMLRVTKFNITDQLGEITMPTFVIVGENDDAIPPHVAKALCDALPRAYFAVVKGADHVPMSEQPAEFNRLLKKFLKWVICESYCFMRIQKP